INLPFVRLLRDLVRHDIYANEGSKVAVLADDKDPRRQDYLDRFVDKESQTYLLRFWQKYKGKDNDARLSTFLDGLRAWPMISGNWVPSLRKGSRVHSGRPPSPRM
ncbi:hypothetical protein QO207_23405, partial [Pseudomonas sp. CAN2814]|uniref:hypothetical protein n=1 Tax=Pseudomonas sp. CAN1 TaxID=3046726 RepID=UPI0026497CF0